MGKRMGWRGEEGGRAQERARACVGVCGRVRVFAGARCM